MPKYPILLSIFIIKAHPHLGVDGLSDYPLHQWALLELRLDWIYDSPILKGTANATVQHNSGFSAWLLRRGWVSLTIDDEETIGEPGDWMIHHASKVTQKFSPDAEIFSLHGNAEWPEGRFLFSGGPVYHFSGSRYPELEKIGLALQEIFQGDREKGVHNFRWVTKRNIYDYLRGESLWRAWLLELARILHAEGHSMTVPVPTDQRLTQALDILQHHHEPYFPKEEVTASCNLSLIHLNRLCKERLGHSLTEQWQEFRIRRAQQALGHPSASIKELAFELGFKQASHFTRWFRKRTGLSPKEYRVKASQRL